MADLGRPREDGADAPQPLEAAADRAVEVVGRGCRGPDAGEDLGAVREERLDVLPGSGVAAYLPVGVAGFVDRLAVRVAEGVRHRVPGRRCLVDAVGCGGKGPDAHPPHGLYVAGEESALDLGGGAGSWKPLSQTEWAWRPGEGQDAAAVNQRFLAIARMIARLTETATPWDAEDQPAGVDMPDRGSGCTSTTR